MITPCLAIAASDLGVSTFTTNIILLAATVIVIGLPLFFILLSKAGENTGALSKF